MSSEKIKLNAFQTPEIKIICSPSLVSFSNKKKKQHFSKIKTF
jgi:hypothetical protein